MPPPTSLILSLHAAEWSAVLAHAFLPSLFKGFSLIVSPSLETNPVMAGTPRAFRFLSPLSDRNHCVVDVSGVCSHSLLLFPLLIFRRDFISVNRVFISSPRTVTHQQSCLGSQLLALAAAIFSSPRIARGLAMAAFLLTQP